MENKEVAKEERLGKGMKITKYDVEERYLIYNKKYFEEKLPKIHFSTYIGKGAYGVCTYNPHNKWKSKIEIARNVDWSEADFESTVIHEMVHLYLDIYDPRYRGKNPLYNRSHGRLFKQQGRHFKELGIDIISKPKSKLILSENRRKFNSRFVQALYDWVYIHIL